MRSTYIALILSAALSGCMSAGPSPLAGLAQSLGYPDPPSHALTSSDITGSIQPALPQPVASEAVASPAERVFIGPPAPPASSVAAEADETSEYDMTKDPYVTSVLLPPVERDSALQYRSGLSAKAAMAPPAKLEIVDFRTNNAALEVANPE